MHLSFAADDDRAALTEVIVGQPSAKDRCDVNQAGKPAIEFQRAGIGPAEAEAAVAGAEPLSENGYKIEVFKGLVTEELEGIA